MMLTVKDVYGFQPIECIGMSNLCSNYFSNQLQLQTTSSRFLLTQLQIKLFEYNYFKAACIIHTILNNVWLLQRTISKQSVKGTCMNVCSQATHALYNMSTRKSTN